ncbi:hypothetical protein [Hymenobacter coccineus]|uniref:Uncharacterized protein n=1 Tax=Hymenobacter coccineus TaxID=1908235 RepID=A0A1G1SYQ6_9BACT|nr:hypothetical protein [Hymenobacter coccineus]OGX83750.1 hypothetical protein BEN49_12025 [Hymenobacter coccineus]
MKTALTLITGLALASWGLPVRAQTVPAKPPRPAAAPRPEVTGAVAREPGDYKGPHVVKDTKALGQKFIEHSRPSDDLSPRYPRPSPK